MSDTKQLLQKLCEYQISPCASLANCHSYSRGEYMGYEMFNVFHKRILVMSFNLTAGTFKRAVRGTTARANPERIDEELQDILELIFDNENMDFVYPDTHFSDED